MYLLAVNDTPTKIVESAIAHRLIPRQQPEPTQPATPSAGSGVAG